MHMSLFNYDVSIICHQKLESIFILVTKNLAFSKILKHLIVSYGEVILTILVKNINNKKPTCHSTLFNVKFKGSDVDVEI